MKNAKNLDIRPKCRVKKTVRVFCDCVSPTAKSRCQQVQKTGKFQSVFLLFTATDYSETADFRENFLSADKILSLNSRNRSKDFSQNRICLILQLLGHVQYIVYCFSFLLIAPIYSPLSRSISIVSLLARLLSA